MFQTPWDMDTSKFDYIKNKGGKSLFYHIKYVELLIDQR